ncbi:hypothetical protein NL108_011427 [Boleophthalmus pectinirostris]|uniref:tetratricopeptide repeat protein 31-like n=1 Tax=Boleophthalmus pectinirostris TaxID=150288 RepID=UPI00242C610D|nr:tetratricopeptide repeat protein 31-like [Boleophthalmus pectinirostris]KAJ0055789.1 hypothetical protein NL108_011427 [Boleophthalmus pectinirostris]
MSFTHRQAAAFARVKVMGDFYAGLPDIEGFIQESFCAQMQDEDVHFYQNFTGDDWKDIKHKYGIKVPCGPNTESSDDDLDWESDAERKARLLSNEKKIKEKAEKKRLKKQRQKVRKRLEKQQNTTQDKIKDKASEVCEEDKEYLNLRAMASSLNSESSNNTSDGSSNEEDEGLDLTSSFVTKAAEIAKRQLEQKHDKKKSPLKEEPKTPEKTEGTHEANHVNKDPVTSSPKMEDFVKMSAELAMIGNKLAGVGEYKIAVNYFTDAIKYNPTEYRLFGNRAFCFERMQEYEKSLSDAELSLSMSPGWVRGLFRKGRALAGLKRYEEAACAFKKILELNGSSPEAAQELMNVQILQLMENGFTREQSSNALIIHGNVEKAQEALSKLNKLQVSPPAPVPVQQVANVTGVSPGLSAKAAAAPRPPLQPPLPPAQDASKTLPLEKTPLIPVQNQQSQPKPNAPAAPKSNHVEQAPELFPVWVGNLSFSVTENLLGSIFNKVGPVYSLKQLPAKRCAFINYTQQQHCDDAIRRYHGFELMGSKIAVRYPDRIPPGLNISKSAHKANHPSDENISNNLYERKWQPYYKYRDPFKY